MSSSCNYRMGADPYDSMGSFPGYSYGAINTNALGWLDGQFYDVTAGAFTRTYTLKPFTDPAHVQRALRLKDGPITLWLEYRAPVGIDEPGFAGDPSYLVEPGLVIHEEFFGLGVALSSLLDMTPGSPRGFNDAALPVGRTWANPLGEMEITVNSVTPTAATVTI